ncbi:MAG: hypothetical protein CMM90_04935 [Rickettsiales bacterium]|nr:hypothetical protein [Rickettsiales bacterium]|tara:strand:+ start:4658 stop:4861 length:204 start_codon:yes stop_codon:yes gene_type:complete
MFSFAAFSCPYQSMAEIDQKLYSPKSGLSSDEFSKIVNLRQQGQKELENGNIEKSEETLNKALALIK